MNIYTESECAAYMAEIAKHRDLLLQAWRTSLDALNHVKNISGGALEGPNVVFDAGCGTGQFLHLYQTLFPEAECYGMNLFQCQLDMCKNPTLHLMRGDLRKDIPISFNGRFSKVFCHYTMGHFSDEEAEALIKRFSELLIPGGQLVMWDIFQRSVAVDTILGYRLRTSSFIHRAIEAAGMKAKGTIFTSGSVLSESLYKITSKEVCADFRDFTVPILHIGEKSDGHD